MSRSPRRPGVHQEEDRVPLRPALLLALFGVLFTAGSAWWAFAYVSDHLATVSPMEANRTPPRVEERRDLERVGRVNLGLITGDSMGFQTLEARDSALERWGWADRDSQLVQVPISQAMRLYLARQRPAADAAAADTTATDAAAVDPTGPPGGGVR